MMPMNEDGMQLDPQILIQTQNNFIAQARIKEVQMEAGIQQLRMQVAQQAQHIAGLEAELDKHTADAEEVEEG